MNMFENYLTFISKNYHKMAKEVLLSYYDEEIFNKMIKEYINIRYYNYYDEDFDVSMNKSFLDILSYHEEEEEKVTNMFVTLNYLLLFNDISIDSAIKILTDYRKEIDIDDNKIFPNNMKRIYTSFLEKEEEFFQYFDSDTFLIEDKKTSKENVVDVLMYYDIEFPEIYNKAVIDEIYNSDPISSEKLLVEYSLVIPRILKDIKNYDYKKNYLVDFSCNIFSEGELLEKIKKFTSNDLFKFKVIFKIDYDCFIKYDSSIKDLIREGYLFAIKIDDEVEIENNFLLNLFKYIIVNQNNDIDNDKIIVLE